jgi:hypothetical protein
MSEQHSERGAAEEATRVPDTEEEHVDPSGESSGGAESRNDGYAEETVEGE